MTPRLLATLPVLALLAACGQAGSGVASGSAPAPTPTPSTTETTGAPDTPAPTGPPYPAYDVEDYDYTLVVGCFCPDAGSPVRVTVRGGKVVKAVFAERADRHAAGDPAPRWQRLTIDDVIADANTPGAYDVDVRWRDGEGYPRSVWIDERRTIVDEERSYTIRHVRPVSS